MYVADRPTVLCMRKGTATEGTCFLTVCSIRELRLHCNVWQRHCSCAPVERSQVVDTNQREHPSAPPEVEALQRGRQRRQRQQLRQMERQLNQARTVAQPGQAPDSTKAW